MLCGKVIPLTTQFDHTVDGTPVSEVERLKNHWLNNYDWRTHEAKINELPQFTMPFDMGEYGEMTVHFVHKKSSRPDAIPLIFSHGWPGSFHEVHKILPLLTEPTDPNDQAFHVVAPRLLLHLIELTIVYRDTAGPRILLKRASI